MRLTKVLNIRWGLSLGILLASVFAGQSLSWVGPSKVQPPQQDSVRVLPASVKQLPSALGLAPTKLTPVEIQRATALLSATGQLQEYSCVVKNNTNKVINFVSLSWVITNRSGNEESSITELQLIDSFIHEDVREAAKLRSIAKGEEYVAQSSGPASFGNGGPISRIEVSIDYIEFDDKTVIGPDTGKVSSQRKDFVREGARRYKQWLVTTYKQYGESLDTVLSALRSRALPQELNLDNALMTQGALIYRNNILSAFNREGSQVIEKYLNR